MSSLMEHDRSFKSKGENYAFKKQGKKYSNKYLNRTLKQQKHIIE